MKLEQQAIKIQDIMYDSMTKHNFYRVSGAVDRDLDKVDTNNIKPTYDSDTILTQVAQNMIRTLRVHPKTLTQRTKYKMIDMITE